LRLGRRFTNLITIIYSRSIHNPRHNLGHPLPVPPSTPNCPKVAENCRLHSLQKTTRLDTSAYCLLFHFDDCSGIFAHREALKLSSFSISYSGLPTVNARYDRGILFRCYHFVTKFRAVLLRMLRSASLKDRGLQVGR
jgi:hypothetical protein